MIKAVKPVVVGIGEILWDILPTGKSAGGAPVNFVYHAVRQGAEGYVISAAGKDVWGDEILRELQKNKIGCCIERAPYPTGTVRVELNEGLPSYTIAENAAWDHIPLTQAATNIVKQADAVCYGTLALRNGESRETVKKLLRQTRAEACRFFDINLRGNYYSKELIRELLEFSNIFKINDEEMAVVKKMFGLTGSDGEICRYFLRKYDLHGLIFTAGEKDSIVYTPSEESRMKTPRVNVADTVGAGDAFSGAFIQAWLTGKNLREAHEKAIRTAAFVCTKPGARPLYDGEEGAA